MLGVTIWIVGIYGFAVVAAAVAAADAAARIGAASTHTQVTPDQMPKGYVSFDSSSVTFTTARIKRCSTSARVLEWVMLCLPLLLALVLHRL